MDPVRKPVFGLDIDGTLGEYHNHFIRFARQWMGKRIPEDYDGTVPMAKWCGVGRQKYRECKLAYRRGGLKRSMPCFSHARELSVNLRRRGAKVVICTTRPYLALDNIEPDTKEWLRRNRIQHDGILSGEHKYRDLRKMYGQDNIVAILDDLPEMILQAWDLGITAVLRARIYNTPTNYPLVVHNLRDAERVMLELLGKWEASQ